MKQEILSLVEGDSLCAHVLGKVGPPLLDLLGGRGVLACPEAALDRGDQRDHGANHYEQGQARVPQRLQH